MPANTLKKRNMHVFVLKVMPEEMIEEIQS